MADKDATTIQNFNALLQDNLDAVAVLEEAVNVIDDATVAGEVRGMLSEHRDAASRLEAAIRAYDEEPTSKPHLLNAVRESWQKVWRGSTDTNILLALRANERVALDKLKLAFTADAVTQAMTTEGAGEYKKALTMELNHFRYLTDTLRDQGVSVDNDETMGAVRNVTEHLHAAINLTGSGLEDFVKWIGSKVSTDKSEKSDATPTA
jgi:hypothetical protein